VHHGDPQGSELLERFASSIHRAETKHHGQWRKSSPSSAPDLPPPKGTPPPPEAKTKMLGIPTRKNFRMLGSAPGWWLPCLLITGEPRSWACPEWLQNRVVQPPERGSSLTPSQNSEGEAKELPNSGDIEAHSCPDMGHVPQSALFWDTATLFLPSYRGVGIPKTVTSCHPASFVRYLRDIGLSRRHHSSTPGPNPAIY
jgi:hypothetical protein